VTRASLGALAVAAIGITIYVLRDREVPIPQFSNPVQVTNAIGVEDHPTWSPDSRTLAYESNETGNWDVWLAQVGAGPSVNRTADHLGDDRYVSWSPDGRQIAFWSDRDGGGYYVLPALGGVPTRIVQTAGQAQAFHSPPAWSTDGTLLACAIYTTTGGQFQAFVEIVSLVTRDTRRVPLPGVEEARLDLSWSADGRYLAYVDAAQQPSETTQLRVLGVSDGNATTLSDGRSNIRRPKWSPDGRHLYFVSNRIGPPDLWRQRIADGSAVGDPERVTTGLEVRGAVFSPDGTKVAYSKGRWVSNIWRVPIFENRPAMWADAAQMTFEQAFIEFLSVSRDGRTLAYSSDRAGNQDVWLKPIGGEARQMTADPAPDWSPLLSPDGQQIAFYSFRTGDREIWMMPSTGGAATQLTRSRGLDVVQSWSPDGRQLAFRSERTGDSEIWVMAADGTGLRQITNHPAGDYAPSWSPDGRWLAFISARGGQFQIWRVLSTGGEPELLIPAVGLMLPLWSREGNDIYFASPDGTNFQAFSLKGRSTRPVTELAGRRGTLGGQQSPATDGEFLYFTWRDDLGDIWVMDVVQD
jgi:TolB protein